MNLRYSVLALALFPVLTLGNDRLVRESEPLTPGEERVALKVPDGFEVQLFAAEPMINKPVNLAFDNRGRLWVSSTVEYPYAAEKERWSDEKGTRVRESRDAIKILEDTDGDGAADKVTDFADGLNIPTGVLPWHKPEHEDGCIAWSIPNIWYFADTTGDGKADHREVLFGPLGWEKDTHGMCSNFRMGPGDGWVYATHGFNNTSHFEAKDGSTLDLNSGNVFRFRPDGSRVEIWSWGQVNPFGLAFDRRGNLYSADCHSAPVYQLLHGATYPSFSKPHDGLGFGPAMIEHTHGSTGICGIVYIDRDVWGNAWNDTVLIGNPVNSRVNRDSVQFVGSTPTAIEEKDFIESDDPWFRPVDLCLGPDGALYIADFYNRIIGHYEVPLDHPGRDRERGRIWRVVKTDSAVNPDRELPRRVRIDDPIAALESDSPFVRRRAAEILRSDPDPEAMEPLWRALNQTPGEDTHLRHALRLAVREHLKLPGAFGLFSWTPVRPEMASIVLSVGTPDAAEYSFRSLIEFGGGSKDTDYQRALTHIARYGANDTIRRAIEEARQASATDWSDQAACISAIREGLEERGPHKPPSDLLHWSQTLAREMLADEAGKGAGSWTALPHPNAPQTASPWTLQPRLCADGTEATVLSSLRRGEPKVEQRTGILRSREFSAPETVTLWVCGHRGFPGQPAHDKNRVRVVKAGSGEEVASAFPPRNDICREVTWDLSKHEGESVRLEIIDGDSGKAYAWLGITRINVEGVEVASFRETGARAKALGQLASMLKVTAPVDLRDRLKAYLPAGPKPPPMPVSEGERKRLDQLIRERVEGFDPKLADLENGLAVFKTNCAACHQVGGEGGLIGPQLEGIGSRGIARLCEDILDPSRNVDAHFYLTRFTLKGGATLGGFVLSEPGERIHLVDIAGQEHRFSKSEIVDRKTSALSVMPPNFGEVIAYDDFRDLLGWLLQQK